MINGRDGKMKRNIGRRKKKTIKNNNNDDDDDDDDDTRSKAIQNTRLSMDDSSQIPLRTRKSKLT